MSEAIAQIIGEIITGILSAIATAYVLRIRVANLEREVTAVKAKCAINHPLARVVEEYK